MVGCDTSQILWIHVMYLYWFTIPQKLSEKENLEKFESDQKILWLITSYQTNVIGPPGPMISSTQGSMGIILKKKTDILERPTSIWWFALRGEDDKAKALSVLAMKCDVEGLVVHCTGHGQPR